ncbi:MAG: ribose-phosphate diphosphokinase [Acidobacteriota bacterium]
MPSVPDPDRAIVLFATPAYRPMAEAMVALGGLELGELEVRYFPDGERYLRIHTPVAGRRVALLGGTVSDGDTLLLYDLAFAASKYGALDLSLLLPYFGYSTMERVTEPGEVVTAKSRARLLSSIPLAHHGNTVYLLDLHTRGLPNYFEGPVTTIHLSARDLVLDAIRELADGRRYVLACTDAGRAKWVESLANDLGVGAAFVFKRRLDGATTEITAMAASVEDRMVVIYDDMIRTGGSLLDAAEAYRRAGAAHVAAVATHGVLPDDALRKLARSGLLDAVVTTDSHPRALAVENDFLRLRSVAPMLRDALVDGRYLEA